MRTLLEWVDWNGAREETICAQLKFFEWNRVGARGVEAGRKLSQQVATGMMRGLLEGGLTPCAVLYALDGSTGKELWSSGRTITGFSHSGGLAFGGSKVYVSTHDGTLYAFGYLLNRD